MLGKLKIKYIQSLGQKKLRDKEDVFIAEGPKIVAELLAANNMEITELFALPGWIKLHAPLLSKISITEINEAELGKISQQHTPNQVLAIVRKLPEPADMVTKDTITLALDTIRDPGNIGTIIRMADWFGIKQIVCSNDCADIYNPKVVQSTMGSIARVKMLYTDLVAWLSQQDVRIYATVLEGKDVTTMKKITEGIVLIGNESKGISDEVMKLANVKITVPKKGEAESLNAAVATGIILSHLT